ncbi:MAG: hypothetical protein HYV08_03630, partial [Deltaproteobacteria bacterium]|nr:hypothetical protein [Deltaproteobacteria bacterium]
MKRQIIAGLLALLVSVGVGMLPAAAQESATDPATSIGSGGTAVSSGDTTAGTTTTGGTTTSGTTTATS